MSGLKYSHNSKYHNLDSPREIVPIIMDLFHPASVVDVGCGTGTFLHCFREQGVQQVLGLDGEWVNRDLLHEHLASTQFLAVDLEQPLALGRRFDVALCLEVAEHLDKNAAATLVRSLVQLSDIILFSAAIPGQGGENHLNEQPVSYWQQHFAAHGYVFHDIFRPYLWNNGKVFWWYRQNLFLVTKGDIDLPAAKLQKYLSHNILDYVHPGLLAQRNEDYSKVINGRLGALKSMRIAMRALLYRITRRQRGG